MSGIESVVATLSSGVTARPRLTHYDSVDGVPERIELSGRVLLNWVSKAANLLREEFDAEPGTRVAIDLPAGHWRAAYWALATWAVGATVLVVEPGAADSPSVAAADVIVSTDPGSTDLGGSAAWPPRVVVTPAALARRHPQGVPAGAFDEAAVLATYGDVFDDMDSPGPDEPALVAVRTGGDEDVLTFAELGAASAGGVPGSPERLLLLVPTDPVTALTSLLATWAGDGSVVVSRSAPGAPPTEAEVALLEQSEGVTRRA